MFRIEMANQIRRRGKPRGPRECHISSSKALKPFRCVSFMQL